MIRTHHDQPQVIVTIEDTPVVCASVDCDFMFVESTSEVTSMSVSNLDITIAGTGLP